MPGSSESPDRDFEFNDLSQQPHERDGANPSSADREASKEVEQAPKPKRIACILCRKRKLRCDGARPTCGTCKRLKHDCAYDEVRRKSGPKRGYVKQLEARLQQVETLLKAQESTEAMQPPTAPSAPTVHFEDAVSGLNMYQPGGISPSEPLIAQGAPDGVGEEPFPWEMIGLGLDEPLPPQDEINELNQIYFSKIHASGPVIHRPRFYAAMNLAPFMRPPVCLRYAMWALAASVSDKYEALQQHFYQRARKYAQIDEMRGHGESTITLGHCQAWALICTYEFKQMYFPRAWMSAGRAVRLSQMMMLHRLDGTGLDVKQVLPPAKDWTEREERRRTFWGCFCIDRYASIGTGWPMTIDEADIQTNLPSLDEAFDKSRPMPSPSLEEALTPSGAGRVSSYAAVCLTACCFGRNLIHLHRPTADDREDDMNGEFWKRHRHIDNILLNTLLALPQEMRLPTAINNSNAIFFHMCLHTSTICLHQAAIFKADKNRLSQSVTNESKLRCMNAASEIASVMRMISHVDLSAMNPFIAFAIYVAARVFVQWLRQRPKDQQVISSLQFLLQAMHALKKRNPLTESFMVQLDVDLEGMGIPGLRMGLEPNPARVSEIPVNYDNLSCAALFDVRVSQQTDPNAKPSPYKGEAPGLTTASDSSGMSNQQFTNLESISTPFGYVPSTTQSGGTSQQAQHRQFSPESSNRSVHSVIIPILDSAENSHSEMDTSPDSRDQATPSSSIHRGSSSSTSAQGDRASPHQPNQYHRSSLNNATTGTTAPTTINATAAHPQSQYYAPAVDDFSSLTAHFYPTAALNTMHTPSTNGDASYAVPGQADWSDTNGVVAGGVSTGLSPLSGHAWNQMLDMSNMGYDLMGNPPQHAPDGTTNGWAGRQ